MKVNRFVIILISILMCIALGAPAWAQSQGGSSGKDGMMGGGMHHKMMGKMQGQGKMGGGMGGCPMAMGSGCGCPMGMGDGCPKAGGGWMGSFHKWMKNFMVHADLFNLSDKQMQELEGRFSDQFKSAIRNKADMNLMKIDLIQALREEPMQTKQVRDLLRKMADREIDMKMNALEMYSQIMEMLDDQQKQRVRETIGSPFPLPWEQKGGMGGNGGDQ